MSEFPGPAGTAEFKTWLEGKFAHVEESLPFSNLKYVEFLEFTKCRNADLDIRIAREQTWERFVNRVYAYIEDKNPNMTLFWRIVPEDKLNDAYVVLKYDENGPDKDFYSDKRCHADKDWKRYAVYARFAVASVG